MSSTIPFPTLEQSNVPELSASPSGTAPVTRELPENVDGPGRKLKGRRRIIHHLQRISSSPSLAQVARRRAASNPYSTRGSLSCISLASASPVFSEHGHNHGDSFSSQSSTGGYSTAPTTPPSTPGLDSSIGVERLNIRVRKARMPGSGSASPSTAPVPADASRPVSRGVLLDTHPEMPEIIEDYFARPLAANASPNKTPKEQVDFWGQMPQEIRLAIFSYLRPIELVRASGTCKMFYELCFDGQLWTTFDASSFYNIISADSLAKIVVKAGPFIRNLNLRGCVQMEHNNRTETIVKACKNLMGATLEGCRHLPRSSLEFLVSNNPRLKSLNLTGLLHVNNKTLKIIAASCPQLEVINVSWCTHMDARGFLPLLNFCPRLTDIRAGEVRGFNNLDVANAIFETNNLERLVLTGCTDLDDDALGYMMHGKEPEIDILTEIPIVPTRRLRHLDLSRCTRLSSIGIQQLAHMIPQLTGLQLSGCTALTDNALEKLFVTTPQLTHVDLEELSELTDNLLSNHLAKSPCIDKLQHISLSYCENLGDAGVLPVLRAAKNIRSLEVDNTRISDLVLAEAAMLIKARNAAAAENPGSGDMNGIRYGLRLICYDCQNVSWTGVREVLSRNAEAFNPKDRSFPTPAPESLEFTSSTTSNVTSTTSSTSDLHSTGTVSSLGELNPTSPQPMTAILNLPTPYFPPETSQSHSTPQPPNIPTREIISLKTFYGWQPTVNEHTRRVLSNDLLGARRLERKWADWMIATEEMNTAGAGLGWGGGMGIWNTGNGGIMGRRRRRRAREAGRVHVAEEEGGQNGGDHHGGDGGGNVGNGGVVAGNLLQGQGEGRAQGQGGAGGVGGRRRRARSGCAIM